jgi:hypothetical protein
MGFVALGPARVIGFRVALAAEQLDIFGLLVSEGAIMNMV